MAGGKVLPSSGQKGPARFLLGNEAVVSVVTTGPSSAVVPDRPSRSAIKLCQSTCQRVQNHLLRPVKKAYYRLSWTARHTINEAVSLCALLYIFLTVPFRVAFYYNPHAWRDPGSLYHWTEELTIFALTDGVVDFIGLFQFFSFCWMWKNTNVKLAPLSNSEGLNSTSAGADRSSSADTLKHSASYRAKRRGASKWTIASIQSVLSSTGDARQKVISHQNFVTVRNVKLVLEIVATVPVEVVVYASERFALLHLVRITKLCRLYRLQRCIKRIVKIYSDRGWIQHLSSTGVDSLVFSVGFCAGLAHWVACGYMLIAHVQCGLSLEDCDEHMETSWVVRDRLFGASVLRKYARTLYWATRTLVLLGYDDVTPVSTAETLYAVIVTLMGALFGSSLLANYLFLFRFRNARYAAYSAHVDNAREYMRLQNIPRPVRQKVIAYFNYSWATHHGLDSEEALHLMPKHLQSKVVSTLKASRIKQVCFLVKESVEFINHLALALMRRIYSPGDQIIEPNSNAEMFFVIRGKVAIAALDGSNSKECSAGDLFAESCLLFPEQYEQNAVAKTFCELYVLAKTKFDEALTEFYRGSEGDIRNCMADTLEKHFMQQIKMQKLLGQSGAHEIGNKKASRRNSRSLIGGDIISSGLARSDGSWRLPDSSFCAHWDMVRLVGVIYVAFEVPYYAVFITMTGGKLMFSGQREVAARYILTFVTEVFFTVDLVLRSRYFAYLEQNVMLHVMQSNLIFTNYKMNGFYLDLLAWLPAGLILESLPSRTLQGYSSLFRLCRLLRVRLAPTLLKDISEFYGKSSKLRQVVSLILYVTFLLHVVGCIWFQMALYGATYSADKRTEELTRSECLRQATEFHNCSWVIFDCYSNVGVDFPHDNPDSTYQDTFAYLRSVYWAIVALTGVGYGDIVAYSTAESFFAALWIFIGGVINFGVVGVMSSTISNIMSTHHHHIEKLNWVNSTLERLGISDKLSTEVRRFYHHQFTGRKQAYESQLLSNLPDQLCYHISSLLHSEAVKSVSLFDSASNEFLKEVTGKFRNKSYQNGETICLEGDICRQFFVLLHDSRVNVFYRSQKVPVRALCNGDCYGVTEFLLKRPFCVTLTAASLVHASVMTRDQFDAVQRKFSSDANSMKQEAETLWTEEQRRLMRIVGNLKKLKLQSHLMQTPTLFYQRETAVIQTRRKQTLYEMLSLRDTFTSVWQMVISCWNLYNALFVIFRIGFSSHLHFGYGVSRAVWISDLSCDACFAMDIYLRLYYLGCPDAGINNLVTRLEVDKHYLHSKTFKWDLLASLPVYAPLSSGSLIAGLCRLPRLVRCVNIWGYLDDAIVLIQQHFASHNVAAYLGPVKLMIILVLVAHYVGCIFVLISEHECSYVEKCWIATDHVLHEYHHSVPILYAKAFYWAITTLLLVGSRELVERGTAGTLWAGFTCLCSTFIIGHIVGEISELILDIGKETKLYKGRIASFERFAIQHNIPETLRDRVTFFFRVEFEYTEGLDLQHTMHDLSANLRLKMMLEIYGPCMINLPICRFLTPSQVNNLTLRLQSELFIPGDSILVEGTFGNRLCTLRKGMAAVYWTKAAASVALLMEGALFGEVAFFLPNQQRVATVRAVSFCEVLYVSKHDWRELWVASGNASDNQVQKHALHAILGWVSSRIQRYQHASLNIAGRVKKILSPRAVHKKTKPSLTGSKPEMQASENLADSIDNGTNTSPRKLSKSDVCRLFVSPEVQVLEKKAEYILSKTESCAQKYGSAIAMMQTRRSSLVDTIRSSMRSTSHSRGGGQSRGGRGHSSRVDPSSTGRGANSRTDDIRLLQFIVDLNPINKLVRESLGKEGIRLLEQECWANCRTLAEAQHAVSKLLNALFPEDSSGRPRIKGPNVRQRTLLRTQSWTRSNKPRKREKALELPAVKISKKTSGPDRKDLGVTNHTRRRRRFSVGSYDQGPNGVVTTAKPELAVATIGMIRCRSLPAIRDEFFGVAPRNNLTQVVRYGRMGIDFEVLQRCQRPQYALQLSWYHRYCHWRDSAPVVPNSAISPGTNLTADSKKKEGSLRSQMNDMQLPSFRRIAGPRTAAMGSSLHLPSQRSLLTATTDLRTKQFIHRVEKIGKAWDFIMLFVAVYHLVVTPLKVSFAFALVELPVASLRNWSALDVFFDVLCLMDVGYQLNHALTRSNSVLTGAPSSRSSNLLRALTDLRADLMAILPLELMLFATEVRMPVLYVPTTIEPTNASWWSTRWLLRLNRIFLIQRIEPLSEKFFQVVVHDLKLPITEARLSFLRALSAYFAMGHLLACMWFLTSEIGFHHYSMSWLSTSGMLTFIPSVASSAHEAGRMLSETTGTFYLESVSMSRKYMRSLLFSVECISTLFYGDILSMNPLELVVEIGITFWSIYIFGALVGAQAELLDARAKREAAFEQNLGELQHYVVQNGVPKTLKMQIKAYYARLWRRCRGENDFTPVSSISRVLYEDVVLSTLRNFALQVKAFRSLDEQFLRGLLVCLQHVVCSEGEEVVMKGDVDRSMYFIAQGRILIKIDSSEVTRERGEHFGELTLLYSISRLETCVALTVAELYRLDHEPYERLLIEFPEYRVRNKVAWTTLSAAERIESRVRLKAQSPQRPHTTLASRPSIARIGTLNERIMEARLPLSFVHQASMKMIARMQDLSPLEAKTLILKCREAACKHLLRGEMLGDQK